MFSWYHIHSSTEQCNKSIVLLFFLSLYLINTYNIMERNVTWQFLASRGVNWCESADIKEIWQQCECCCRLFNLQRWQRQDSFPPLPASWSLYPISIHCTPKRTAVCPLDAGRALSLNLCSLVMHLAIHILLRYVQNNNTNE